MRRLLVVIGVLMSPSLAQAQSAAPPQVPALNASATPRVTLSTGSVQAPLEIGAATLVTVGAQAVVCGGLTPASCPAPPIVAGLSDTSTAWSATRLDGRMLLLRNAGPGVLSLRAQDASTPDVWRIAQGRLVPAGDVAMLVYDATAAHWRVLGVNHPAQ